jgi:plasmid maintenance system antidote protein VapI
LKRQPPRPDIPSERITEILNERRLITADAAVRLGRTFGNSTLFRLGLQSQHDIAVGASGGGKWYKEICEAGEVRKNQCAKI